MRAKWLNNPKHVAIVFALGACAGTAATATADAATGDVWWLAAAGRDMLASHAVPTRNLFSYAAPDTPWVMHEWLYGIVYAIGLTKLGPACFALFTSLTVAAIHLALVYACFARARSIAAGATALAIPFFSTLFALQSPRPSLAALVFPACMGALLFTTQALTRARIAMVLFIELVWANAHGSFPLGVVLLLVATLEAPTGGERKKRAFVTVAAALLTFINPYGAQLHALVLSYLLGTTEISRFIHSHIVEFFPIWRSGGRYWDIARVLGLVLVGSAALSALLRRRTRIRAGLALLLVVGAVLQVRHVPLAVVLGGILVAAEVDALMSRDSDAGELTRPQLLWVGSALLPSLVFGLMAWSSDFVEYRNDPYHWLPERVGGAPVVRLLERMPANANVYVPFHAAGISIWFGQPRAVRVFYDPRNDCYPIDVARAHTRVEQWATPSEEIAGTLVRYGTQYAIVERNSASAHALSVTHDFVETARDGRWVSFAAVRPPD